MTCSALSSSCSVSRRLPPSPPSPSQQNIPSSPPTRNRSFKGSKTLDFLKTTSGPLKTIYARSLKVYFKASSTYFKATQWPVKDYFKTTSRLLQNNFKTTNFFKTTLRQSTHSFQSTSRQHQGLIFFNFLHQVEEFYFQI